MDDFKGLNYENAVETKVVGNMYNVYQYCTLTHINSSPSVGDYRLPGGYQRLVSREWVKPRKLIPFMS